MLHYLPNEWHRTIYPMIGTVSDRPMSGQVIIYVHNVSLHVNFTCSETFVICEFVLRPLRSRDAGLEKSDNQQTGRNLSWRFRGGEVIILLASLACIYQTFRSFQSQRLSN